MNGLLRMRSRARRLLVVLGTVLIYVVLLIADGTHSHFIPSSLYLWLTFGFSAFVALIFLSVGSLVWLYARDRHVAALLLASCCASMIPFTVETAALSGDPFFAMVAGTGSILAFILYSLLLLAFPMNFLALIPANVTRDRTTHTFRLRRPALALLSYLVVLLSLGAIALAFPIVRFFAQIQPLWLSTACLIFVVFAIIGIMGTITLCYNNSVSVRQKQQLFLFVLSVPLAFVPFLILTVVPQLLHLPSQFVIDPQLSTLSMVLIPLAMGYAVLRYQVMVLDTYIRRAAIWIVGTVFLALSSYLIVAFYTFLFASQMTIYVVSVVVTSAILTPCVWWLAKVLTGHLFFNEMLHYHRLLEQPSASIDRTLTLDEAANLLTLATESAFETSRVALFVLDESSGYYHIRPALIDDSSDENRRELLCAMLRSLGLPDSEHVDALEQHSPFITQVAASHRPLLLSEVSADRRVGLANKNRLLIARADQAGDHLLLAPLRVQGKMIGVLLLGEHGNYQQQYAGPDFEAVQVILSRFSPILETARLYERANQQAVLLNGLYGNVPAEAFRSTNEVADAYVALAAETALVRAEIWLAETQNVVLQCVGMAGSGPHLVQAQTLQLGEQDWLSCFSSGYSANDLAGNAFYGREPSCLSACPTFPFAWLPLARGERRLGVIVLTYPRPHRFFKEETKVLLMFAQQCTAALLNVAMTVELRTAYERQKELDRLKDQFIITASHELRTPLTAVQGYIELLNEYNSTLSEEARANFIAKAHRGCDELTLMVGNIMDASRVQIDAENVRLSPISLRDSIQHVLEILEAIIRREQRAVCVNVPDTLVLADDIRLRQVLLNLVSNALKYSPAATKLEISAQVVADQLTVRVRDYGPGILPQDHHRLFDRFMRLDRDMNSPVRGAGLGLYICKQLVEAMGGDIWVESQGLVGEGSTFAFSLACVDKSLSTRPLSLQNPDLSVW